MHIDSGGVDIHVEVTGAGRPVVLLHGFPDSGRLWRSQVAALSAAGFMVIVPDLRGYGDSAKPASVEEYSLLFLAGDVLAILDHLSLDRAHLVGHDWGSALAWTMASLVPDQVDHLVTLSVGHPAAFRSVGVKQLEKSWYMFFFQFEDVPMRWLSDDSWANLRAWTNHPDIEAAIAELGENGSLTPALNWYRANIPPQGWVDAPSELPPVQAPTMGVWSTGDFALTEQQMTGSAEHVAGRALGALGRAGPLDAAGGSRRGQPAAARLPPGLRRIEVHDGPGRRLPHMPRGAGTQADTLVR